jgi:thiol-disulfide isomerase/thioredoxin
MFFVSTVFSQDPLNIQFQERDSDIISLVGKEAPGIYLLTLNGDDFFLSQILNQDKFVFINFFATWCGPCIEELPDLSKFHKKNAANIEMIIIDVNNLSMLNSDTGLLEVKKEKIEEASKALEEVDAIKLYDLYTTVAIDYNIDQNPTLPQSFLISKGGIVLWESRGRLKKEDFQQLNGMVNDEG